MQEKEFYKDEETGGIVRCKGPWHAELRQWFWEHVGAMIILLVFGGLYAIMESDGWMFWLPLLAMFVIYGSAALNISACLFLFFVSLWEMGSKVGGYCLDKIMRWFGIAKVLDKLGIEIRRD